MNKKRDKFFWWASGIMGFSLILFATTMNEVFLALMIAAILARPTIASLGLAKRYMDEREMSVHYRSGNIAFFVMMIACVILSAKLSREDNHAFEMFYMVIVIGIAAKGFTYVIMSSSLKVASYRVMLTLGVFVAIFSGMGSIQHGIFSLNFLMNILPGITMIGVAVFSKYYPKTAAVLILLIALFIGFFIVIRNKDWATAGGTMIIMTPLLFAVYGLWHSDNEKEE